MNSIVVGIHSFVGWVLGFTSSLIGALGLMGALIALSIVLGIVLVICYGKLSFQKKLRTVKNAIHAALLEVVLFRHAPLLSIKSQGKLMMYGVKYLLLAIPPIAVLAVPSIFLLSQLNAWFGYAPVGQNDPVILSVRAATGLEGKHFSLEHDDSVTVLGPLLDIEKGEVTWRINPHAKGVLPLRLIEEKDGVVPLELVAEQGGRRIEAVYSTSLKDRLLFPSHVPNILEHTDFSRVSISYPERELSLFHLRMSWIWWFLIISILSGMIGGKIFKIEL